MGYHTKFIEVSSAREKAQHAEDIVILACEALKLPLSTRVKWFIQESDGCGTAVRGGKEFHADSNTLGMVFCDEQPDTVWVRWKPGRSMKDIERTIGHELGHLLQHRSGECFRLSDAALERKADETAERVGRHLA